MSILHLMLFFSLCTLGACQKEYTFSFFRHLNENVSIFIQMPILYKSEKDLQVVLYQELVSVFTLAGYENTNQATNYKLKTTITDFFIDDKLISPDVFLLHYHVTLTVEFILYAADGSIVFEKSISKKENFF